MQAVRRHKGQRKLFVFAEENLVQHYLWKISSIDGHNRDGDGTHILKIQKRWRKFQSANTFAYAPTTTG